MRGYWNERIFWMLVFFVSLGSVCMGQEKQKPISIDEIGLRGVQGELGIPLGRCIQIEGEIVSGESLGSKRLQSDYLLKISKIGKRKLKKELIMEYRGWVGMSDFPNDSFSLYEFYFGKKTGSLSSEMCKKLDKFFVGRKFRLHVFETGEFSGLPANSALPFMQGKTFHFRTSLRIQKDLSKVNYRNLIRRKIKQR